MENLIITINDKELKAEFDKNNDKIVYINGNSYEIDLLKSFNSSVHTFSVNKKLAQIHIDFRENSKSVITLDGLSHELEISTETLKSFEKFIKKSSNINNGNSIIKSPMPGLVIKVLVEVGQLVQKGDKIIIIEAMKMENSLSSPISGKVSSIAVSEGLVVEKNQVLLEILPE